MKHQDRGSATQDSISGRMNEHRLLFVALLLLALIYLVSYVASEPFYNNDETRHVMTGVYFRDALHDMPLGNFRSYTINYYLQYPALGLLVWPPFFYFIEGLLMSIFGTSLVVSKVLIGIFAAMACAYLFSLVRRSHGTNRAMVAVLVLGLSPLVFELSHHVMLEIPTLALGLAAAYHFIRYLDTERRRDLFLAGLSAALAALTRFDAVYLIPFFAILLLVRGRLNILWRKEVLAVAALALLLVAPAYALSASGIGWMHFKFATETLSQNDPAFLSFRRLFFYPSSLPGQLGFFALLPAAVGLIAGLTFARRASSWPYFALVIATYLTFTPLGEVESRHAIYWLPAFAFFAADGTALIAQSLRAPNLHLPLAALLLAGMTWTALAKPRLYFRGYAEAAQYVTENGKTSPYCFFVGDLNGDFIYQVRGHDPARKLWVLRADKLLFSVLSVPGGDSQQYATSEQDVLATIFKFDPEFLVVEESQRVAQSETIEHLRNDLQEQVRAVIRNHPERFKLEKEIAVDSNDPVYRGMRLQVFRNTVRNEQPERRLEMEILMLRRSLQTDVP
jgi:4-amino-4-deoxy-L-arabinose transferase-like glycosyltransferase